jgi:hypothetical protein
VIDQQEFQDDEPVTAQRARPSRKYPWAIAVVVVLFVVIPFLSWYGTWFGRQLSDSQMESYLNDQQKPRNVQHALAQIGNRVIEGKESMRRWYPSVIAASQHQAAEVRLMAAWVMGQDNTYQEFHATLLPMLKDESPGVRHNAALALVRFNDAAARPELVAMLEMTPLRAEAGGTVEFVIKEEGTPVAAGTPLARIKQADGRTVEMRAHEAARVETLTVADGSTVSAGSDLMVLSPETEQVWNALIALYIVGQPDDIPYIQRYAGQLPGIPERIHKQAVSTLEAIRERARKAAV